MLIAHWPLEGNAKDEAYGNYNGTEIGGVSYGDGILGDCYDNTSGSGTGIQLMEHADARKFDNVFSWSLWFKSTTTSGGTYQRVISRDCSEYMCMAIDQSQSGSQSINGTGGSAQVNEWHHWAYVHESDTSYRTYLDGQQISSGSEAKSGASKPWVIGGNTERDGDISGNHFEGKIDDVRFYDHVLSKAEIKELAQGKALHMRFDKSPAEDSSGQSQFNDSSTSGGVTVVNDNKIGESAFEFTGSNGVTVQNSPTIQVTTDATICFWAKPFNISSSRQNPFHKDYRDEFTMTKETNGDLSYYFNDSDSAYNNYQAKNMFRNDNEWVHVAAVRNNGSNVVWYRNGSQYSTKSWNGGDPVAGGNDLQIGDGYTNPFDGIIDDFRIYATALSGQEIQTIYETKARLDENHRFFGHQLQENNIRYEWYDTQTYYNNNNHPNSTSGLDQFFDPSNSGVNVGGSGIHENSVAWGNSGQAPNSKPSYLPSDGFSWKVDGSIYVPETGTYTFGVDSDDASDVFINGTQVASFYGGHGFNGNFNNNGTIDLEKGNHSFRARMEEGGGGDGIHVAWQKPSDSSFSTVPQKNYLHGPSVKSTGTIESTLSEVGPAADSLIGWWDFDREDARDKAGGNDGSLINSPNFSKGVERGKSVSFTSGNNERVEFPNGIFSPGQSYTWSVWVKWNRTNGDIYNLQGDVQHILNIGNQGTDELSIWENGNWHGTGYTVDQTNWHHYTVVFDSSLNDWEVYVDSSSVFTTNGGLTGGGGSRVVLGGDDSVGTREISASVDDFRVYDRTLNDEEVNVLYEMSGPDAKMKKRPEGFYAPQFSETDL